jgi:predicted phosphodiesterase
VFAISDLHSSHPANRMIIDDLRPECGDDWLIVAGDVDKTFSDIEKALRLLRQRYAKAICRQPRTMDSPRGPGPTARRGRAEVVVYGHLHIPRTTYYDGVRFEEVSMGYPREWSRRSKQPMPKKVLPG